MKKIIAIDYGQKKLGIAFTESTLADPIGTISGEKRLNKLLSMIHKYDPDIIVLGLPEGPLTEEVLNFQTTLEKKTQKKVVTHPETFSTQQALEKLKAAGASRKKIQDEDKYAATIILQDYLDTELYT